MPHIFPPFLLLGGLLLSGHGIEAVCQSQLEVSYALRPMLYRTYMCLEILLILRWASPVPAESTIAEIIKSTRVCSELEQTRVLLHQK